MLLQIVQHCAQLTSIQLFADEIHHCANRKIRNENTMFTTFGTTGKHPVGIVEKWVAHGDHIYKYVCVNENIHRATPCFSTIAS